MYKIKHKYCQLMHCTRVSLELIYILTVDN